MLSHQIRPGPGFPVICPCFCQDFHRQLTHNPPFSGLRCLHFLQHGHTSGPYILLPGHPEIFDPTNPRSVAAACKTFPLPWPVTLHCELVGKDCLRFFEGKTARIETIRKNPKASSFKRVVEAENPRFYLNCQSLQQLLGRVLQ